MKRYILLFCLFFFRLENSFAECLPGPDGTCSSTSESVGTDITSPGFVIRVGNLDPMNPGDTPIPQGADAVTMLLNQVATFLLYIMPIIAAVSLVIAGYYYILSAGDSEKASKAKNIIKWNAIAIAIAMFSYAIIATIASLLDGNI